MNDLIILHLSDLHITSGGKKYSKLLTELIQDIKADFSSIPEKRVVIVVTGDVIHQGNPKAVANAKKFFLHIKDALS